MNDTFNPTSIKGAFQNLIPKTEGILIGIVKTISPLSIQIVNDEKRVLNERQLIIPRNLTDFKTKVDIINNDGKLESKTKNDGKHSHDYKGNTYESGGHKHNYNGETQREGNHAHSHSLTTQKSGSHNHDITGNTDNSDWHSHTIKISEGEVETGSAGKHFHNLLANIASSGSHEHSVTGTISGNGEHRHKYTGETEEIGDHYHNYSGETDAKEHSHELDTFALYNATITVYNSLKVDELVYLLPYNESKKYYILDRVK